MTTSAKGFGPHARALSRFMGRLDGLGNGLLELTVSILQASVERGDTCLELRSCAGKSLREVLGDNCPEEIQELKLPGAEEWEAGIQSGAEGVVGRPGSYRPLVLDLSGRLYLHRYWCHEQAVAQGIRRRLEAAEGGTRTELLKDGIRRLFGGGAEATDWQKLAAATAVMRRFAVVSGGPGTGKTYTLARILALIVEQEATRGRRPRIALAAPTGKAAARLAASLREARETMDCSSETLDALPSEAFTLHRLLGMSRAPAGTLPPFPLRLLPYDTVVVDECSMADVSLMARLFDALAPDSRLVLAGDKDQLSSVEAGVVMGDICDTGKEHGYRPEVALELRAAAGTEVPASLRRGGESLMSSSLAVLRRNYRAPEGSSLVELAEAAKAGNAAGVISSLWRGSEVSLRSYPSVEGLYAMLSDAAVPWFRACQAALSAEELFRAFSRQAVLCSLRRGPSGVEGVSAGIRASLAREGLLRGEAGRGEPRGPAFPVMVTTNDYALRLFNGDVGIAPAEGMAGGPEGQRGGGLGFLFPRPEGGYRTVTAARLPSHEAAFALTVHKAQGSEFDEVILVLPGAPSPVLSRELLYTAATRARRRLTVFGTEEVVAWMVEHPTRRRSGLRDLLWEP